MDKLYKSPVIFNQEEHTYTLGKNSLSGVTAIVGWLFPRTYDSIPEEVLRKAAERGSMIHESIELFESMGIEMDYIRELQEYKRIKYDTGFNVERTEYLVSDEKNVASSIDLVFSDYELCDIKGTSEVHKKNLMAQLSIYAYLFEKSNPGLKVPRLSCIWLPKEKYGKCKYIPVPRIPSEDCERIIEAYVNGEDPSQFAWLFEDLAVSIRMSEEFLVMVDRTIAEYKAAEEKYKESKTFVEKLLKEYGVSKWTDNGHFTATLGEDSTVLKFDTESFKKDHPDLYNEYLKETTRKGVFRLSPIK